MYNELTTYLKKLGKTIYYNNISLYYSHIICVQFTENDFSDVVNQKQPEDLFVYLQEYHTYDELLLKLDLFQSYRNKAIELVDGWNFVLGK